MEEVRSKRQPIVITKRSKQIAKLVLADEPKDDFIGLFFFSSRRRHTISDRDWSSDVCSSDLVGCGSGVGGIALAKRGIGLSPVVLADINQEALRLAEVNAELAAVQAETVESDVLRGVHGEFDLVIANPPYLRDDAHRIYRDGGGEYGEQLSQRITRESIDRLSTMAKGGRLLLYTGAAIVAGEDTFLRSVQSDLSRPGV